MENKKTRTSLNEDIRNIIYKKDKHKCFFCKKKVIGRKVIHHKKYPATKLSDFVLCCSGCHSSNHLSNKNKIRGFGNILKNRKVCKIGGSYYILIPKGFIKKNNINLDKLYVIDLNKEVEK